MQPILNGTLNSNIFFGILLILAGVSLLYQYWLREKTYWPRNRETGQWTPSLIFLVVLSAISIVVGICALINGIVYAVST